MNSILPNEEEFQLSDHYSKKGKKSALFIFFFKEKGSKLHLCGNEINYYHLLQVQNGLYALKKESL